MNKNIREKAWIIKVVILAYTCMLLFHEIYQFFARGIKPLTTNGGMGITDCYVFLFFVLFFVLVYKCVKVCYRVIDRITLGNVLLMCIIAYCFCTLLLSPSISFAFASIAVILFGQMLLTKNETVAIKQESKRIRDVFFFVVAVAAVIPVLVYRFKALCYYTYGYDMGIFKQMFYSMTQDLSMTTSIERDMFMSHMKVHLSPILYCLLPIYYIFPSELTLRFAGVALYILAVLPLRKLCRLYGLSERHTLFFCIIYLFAPASVCGGDNGFYENAFLPLLLFLFLLFMEEQKTGYMVLAGVFICLVKEEAGLYLASISLYMIFDRKKYKSGAILMVLSGSVFLGSYILLRMIGTNTHNILFANMVSEGRGLPEVFSTILGNPAYLFEQIFDIQNIIFILETMLPVLFLPIRTKRLPRMALLLPYCFFNLMGSYYPLHSIDHHYTYGSCTLLMYLALINLADMKEKERTLRGGVLASILLYVCLFLPKLSDMWEYLGNRDQRLMANAIQEELDKIPEQASVIASEYYVVPLANRKEIYYMPNVLEREWEESDAQPLPEVMENADYVVFDLRWYGGLEADTELFERDEDYYLTAMKLDLVHKYEVTSYIPGAIIVFSRIKENG